MGSRLPSFVVVGAPKCGTTSLYHYLGQHPEVFLPARKELHYFSHDRLCANSAGPGDAHVLRSACATRSEYEGYYTGAEGFAAVGDVSPSYLYYHEAAERMHEELEQARIVMILRDPVEKAFSHYMHLVRDNREPLTFCQALEAEEERTREGWAALWRYVGGSRYAGGVEHYLRVFGEERVLVLFQEELRADPTSCLGELFRFVGVDASFRPNTDTVYHRSGRPRSRLLADLVSKPGPVSTLARVLLPPALRDRVRAAMQNLNTGQKDVMDDETRALLAREFRDDTRRLEALLARRLPWSEEPGP